MFTTPMPRILKRFCAVEQQFHTVLLWVSGAALAAISLISMYQIVARFVLAMPNSWTEVLARTVMIWMIFFALPAVCSNGSLVAFDFFAGALPRRPKGILSFFLAGVNLCTLWVILWFGVRMTMRVSGQAMAGLEGLGATMAWGYAALPIGALLSIPGVLSWLFKALYAVKS